MIKFLFADIPLAAHNLSLNGSESNQQMLSLTTAPLKAPVKFDLISSPALFDYDVQSSPQTADTIIYYDDLLTGLSGKSSVQVKSSSNGTSFSTKHTDNQLTSYGRDNNVYLGQFAASTPRQHWRFQVNFNDNYNAAQSFNLIHKLYLGQSFSFSNPLSILSKSLVTRHVNFETSSGNVVTRSVNYNAVKLQLETICSDAELSAFKSKFDTAEKYNFFMIDLDDLLFDGVQVAFCKLTSFESTIRENSSNRLVLNIEERL